MLRPTDPRPPARTSLAPGELDSGARLGSDARTRAANDAMLALSRAARSCTLYAPDNEAVRTLIGAYHDALTHTLRAHGDLDLEVHPFELRVGSDVVYRERDRERSLAFRLFRDGVRRLSIGRDTTWDELLKLLEVFSIRFTGVRHREEDLLTQLRKAGLAHVAIEAAETYTPDEHDEERALETGAATQMRAHVEPPAHWDLPLPASLLVEPVAPTYVEVPTQVLARLRAEASDTYVPAQALAALSMLLTQPAAMDADDVHGFLREVAEYFVVDGQVEGFARILRAVRSRFEAERAEALVDELATPASLAHLLEAFPIERVDVALLEATMHLVHHGSFDAVVSVLAAERDASRRAVLSDLAIRLVSWDPEGVVGSIGKAPPALEVELLKTFANVAPERALEVAFELAAHDQASLQLAALEVLAHAPASRRLQDALVRLLHGKTLHVRIGAARALASQCGAGAFDPLREHLERDGAGSMDAREACALGEAMMVAARTRATPLFVEWTRTNALTRLVGKLAALVEHPQALQHAAVAGLLLAPTPEHLARVEILRAQCDGELRATCDRALARVRGGHAP